MLDAGRMSDETWHRLRHTAVCAYCEVVFGSRGPTVRTIDHVHPLALGGSNADANLVACCSLCNSRKSKRTLAEWVATGRAPKRIAESLRGTWA